MLILGLDPGLFADLAPHPRRHVLAGVQLAAEPVVLAEVQVVRPRVAVDQQDGLAVRRHDVAQGCQNRFVGCHSELRLTIDD